MARFNEILTGRFNRTVQKLLSMKGPASLVTLSDEMMPVLPFQLFPTEWYLNSVELFGFMTGVAAQGVGNLGAVQIRNPAGSNVIGYVMQVSIQDNVAAQTISFGTVTPGVDLGVIGTSHAVDTRARPSGTMVLSVGTGGALGVTFGRASIPINGSWNFINDLTQGYIINPGVAFQIQNVATNTAIGGIGCLYFERFLEESERT